MRKVLTGVFVMLLALGGVVGPTGCSKDGEPNPELKIPDVPPVSSKTDGKKVLEKK